MANKSYSDILSDRRWQEKKTKILTRDKFICQHPICKRPLTTPLHVHHFFYESFETAPWEYDDTCLITLCEYCHHEEKTRPTVELRLFNTLRMKGFLKADLLALAVKLETEPNFVRELLKISKHFQQNG